MPGRIPNALPRREMQSQWLRQRARWIGALVTGALAIGAMASAYAWLIEQAHRWFVGAVTGHAPIMLLLCPAVGAASVWLTRRYFAGAEGSGIPQTLAALHGGEAVRLRLLTVRLALARIGLTVLATAGGLPVGRQGPTVFVGAVVMHRLRRWTPAPHEAAARAWERRFIVLGAAAGLAAAFQTPLAGLAFAAERLLRRFEPRLYGPLFMVVLVACAGAAMTGRAPLLHAVSVRESAHWTLGAALAAGLVTGLAGSAFSWLLVHPARWMPPAMARLRTQHPVWFSACCGLAVAALTLAAGPPMFGTGHQTIQALSAGSALSMAYPLAYPLAYLLALLLTCLAGIPGGIFVPSLTIGAAFGAALQPWLMADSATSIALSMSGYLAAVTRHPVMSFVIVMEMSGSLDAALPLMTASLVGHAVARGLAPPIYDSLALGYAPRRMPS